jgi:hypothetical protein
MTDKAPPEGEPLVVVAVTRSGGIAGLRREWRVEPAASDVPHWVTLIESCPWDAVDTCPPQGADRYVWRIRARCETPQDTVERDAELQDPQVEGPWQALIDEVRGASGSSPA